MMAALLINIYTISFVNAQISALVDSLANGQFSATSYGDSSCEPWDSQYTWSNDNREAWCCAGGQFSGAYLQINFGRKVTVHAIGTKGRICCNQWVTSYTFSYSDDNAIWTQYDSGVVFTGNIGDSGANEVRHELIFTCDSQMKLQKCQ